MAVSPHVVVVEADKSPEVLLKALKEEGAANVRVCTTENHVWNSFPGVITIAKNTIDDAVAEALTGISGPCLFLLGTHSVEKGLISSISDTNKTTIFPIRRSWGGKIHNDPLRRRFERGQRYFDLEKEPHLFPDSIFGMLVNLPKDLPAWRPGYVKDEGVQFLIQILSRQPQVAISDVSAVQEIDPEKERARWESIDAYEELLIKRIPLWLSNEPIPSWVFQLIIYHLDRLLQKDRGLVFPAANLTETERTHVADWIIEIMRRIPASQVESYCSTPVSLRRRAALLAGSAGEMPRPILLGDKTFHFKRKISYFFVDTSPKAKFFVDGKVVLPAAGKTIDHSYFDRTFVCERIEWVPRGKVQVEIGDNRFDVRPHSGTKLPSKQTTSQRTLGKLRQILRYVKNKIIKNKPASPSGSSNKTPLWLYIDRHNKAGDNAEPFYQYASLHAPEIRHVFAIDRNCADWDRLQAEGVDLVDIRSERFGEIWQEADTFLLSDIGDPLVHPRLNSKGTRKDQRIIFLQHGITMRHMWRWLNDKRFDVLVAATAAEKKAITSDHSQYLLTEPEVWLTGFPRHDHLYSLLGAERDCVVLAPTWDYQIVQLINSKFSSASEILTQYYQPWLSLARSIEAEGTKAILFVHPKLPSEWVSMLDVLTVTGKSLPETLSHAWAVISDKSSVLDEGILLGAVGIIWDPRQRPDTDQYRRMHSAIGAIEAKTSADVLGAIDSVKKGFLKVPKEQLIQDEEACSRLLDGLISKVNLR